MAYPKIRAIGPFVRSPTGAPELTVPLPPNRSGDLLVVVNHAFGPGGSETPSAPGWTQQLQGLTESSWRQLHWRRSAADNTPSVTLARTDGVGGVWVGQAFSIERVDFDVGPFDSSVFWNVFQISANPPASGDNTDGALPPATVNGTERLVLQYIMGDSFIGHADDPINGPGEYEAPFDEYWRTDSALSQRTLFRIARADESIPATGFTYNQDPRAYAPYAFMLAIVGAPIPTRAAEPSPANLSLRCADSYGVYITDDSYDRTLDRVHPSRIRWTRVEDDVSTASVTVPEVTGGVYCCARFGGLEPWRFGLKIERNDHEVWRGPVTSVGVQGSDAVVEAADALSRYSKRLVVRDEIVEYDGTDAGTVFADIINTQARVASDSWVMPAPQVFTGNSLTRMLIPRRLEIAWRVLQEVVDAGIDMFVASGRLYVWEPDTGWWWQDGGIRRMFEGPYNAQADLVYGTFTESSFAIRPDFSVQGKQQANAVFAPGADSGELGFREIWASENQISQGRYGVLDHVEPAVLYRADDRDPVEDEDTIFQTRADSILALRAIPPAVLNGGVLAEGAPIDIDHLVPGALWKLDIHYACYGQYVQLARVKRIEVDVVINPQGLSEQVRPTLHPVGYEAIEAG